MKLCSFGLLFSFHVFVFDAGANCKCVLWIDNSGLKAESLQFRPEGSIDWVQRHVVCITTPAENVESACVVLLARLHIVLIKHYMYKYINIAELEVRPEGIALAFY